jgi:cysteinyl-tRNA synthetase
MELKLYDTLSRDKRVFTPIDPQCVRMYVCGPTVYDFAHIGNARPLIVFDVLFRLLRHIYGTDHVSYVRNITDVDDKINDRAAQEYPGLPLNEAIRQVTEKTARQFHDDVAGLGTLPPTVEPRATEHIAEMALLIERLVKSGNAYVEADHVLFSVPSMPDYGRLAKRSLDEMVAGARVDVAPYKHDPMDFVLWKPSKPGEPAWPSPAGIATPGRPGWHLECSAMSWKHLGETFDIHGGGIDLVFPHHENEIAQSRCAFHTPVMANYWLHNGFLQVEGEKMSKSLGNFITIRDLLDILPGDVIRLQMLMTHYRQPIDWTETATDRARAELEEWADVVSFSANLRDALPPQEIIEALSDDLNTPNAITVLRELFSKAKSHKEEAVLKFAAGCRFLGLRNLKRPGLFRIGVSGMNTQSRLLDFEDDVIRLRAAIANDSPDIVRHSIITRIRNKGLDVMLDKHSSITLVPLHHDEDAFRRKVDTLIAARAAARKAKNFAESDRIRDELAAVGVVLKDSKDGTTWEIAR